VKVLPSVESARVSRDSCAMTSRPNRWSVYQHNSARASGSQPRLPQFYIKLQITVNTV